MLRNGKLTSAEGFSSAPLSALVTSAETVAAGAAALHGSMGAGARPMQSVSAAYSAAATSASSVQLFQNIQRAH